MGRFIPASVVATSAVVLALACLGQPGPGGRSNSAAAGGPTSAPAAVGVCGVMVAGEGYGKDDAALRPLNAFEPGVQVALLVTVRAGQLIAFAESDSRLARLVDDKGGDLTAGEGRFGPAGFIMMGEHVSKDRRAAMVTVKGTRLPSPGAARIVVEGTLAFLYSPSGRRETLRLANIALKTGTRFRVGPAEVEIGQAGKPQSGDGDGLDVQFRSSQDMSGLAAVKFLDAQGREIESSRNSGGRVSFSGITNYTQGYTLKAKAARVTLVIDYWPDVQTIKLPLSVQAGLGL